MLFRKFLFLSLCIILFVINISGCDNNNNNYSDFVQAFAAETEPTTEIISNTAVFSQTEETEKVTEVIETSTEATQPESIIFTESESLTSTTESAQLYVVTPSGKKYHRPTCRYAANVKQYVVKDEAEQLGYEPCKVCKPT